MSTIPHGIISFDDGWCIIKEKGIDKINSPTGKLTSNQRVRLYTIFHDMCTQRAPYNFSRKLYDKNKEIVQDYVNCHVLPLCHSSRKIGSDHFITELPLIKERYEKVMKKHRFIFNYLDKYYVRHHSLLTLTEVSTKLFEEAVFDSLSTHYALKGKQWINDHSEEEYLTKCKNYLEEEKDLWSNLSSTLEDNTNISNNIRNKYEEAVRDYVNCHVVPSCHSSQNLGSDHFIAEQLPLIKKRIEEVMNKYRNIFSCLDIFHTYDREIPTLTEVSTKLLEEAVFDCISTHYIPQWKQWINNYSVKKDHTKNLWSNFSSAMEDTRIRNLLVMEVDQEKYFPIPQLFEQARSEEAFNHDILHKAFTIRSILKSDNSNLEQELLKSTRKYYAKQREDDSKTMGPSEYMKKAEQALKDECQLLSESLSSLSESTAMKMHDITTEELLSKYVENLITFSEGD